MLLASLIQERTRRARISQLGGLAWQAPFLSAFWLVATLAAAECPPGRIRRDFFIFTGSFPAHRWATTVVLAALCWPRACWSGLPSASFSEPPAILSIESGTSGPSS